MAEAKSKFESVREWVVQHKLRTVGCLWLSGIAGSVAYNWSKPNMKTSVRLIHARTCATVMATDDLCANDSEYFVPSEQALTLGALAGAALVEYYDHKSGAKA